MTGRVQLRRTVRNMGATDDFFGSLASRGHLELLEKASGSVRVELGSGKGAERWRVTIDKGDVVVSHKAGTADCTIHSSKALFDRIAGGHVNALAAFLRGELEVEGNWELLVLFQRLFPSPPEGSARSPS
jgi:predicted lipid carrier protein YhbT